MKRNERERKETARAGRQARRAVTIASFSILAGAILGTLIGGFAFDRLNLFYANSQGGSILLLRPHLLIWFILNVPIAVSLSLLTYDPIVAHLKGQPPPRFSMDYLIHSMPFPRFMRIGAIAIAGLFLVMGLITVPYHVRLTESALFLCEPGEWSEHEIPFRTVKEVSLAQYYMSSSKYSKGGPSVSRAVFVTAQNGAVWTPAQSLLAVSPHVSRELALIVSRKAGVEVEFPDRVVGQPSEKDQRARDREFFIFSSVLSLLALTIPYAIARWRKRSSPR